MTRIMAAGTALALLAAACGDDGATEAGGGGGDGGGDITIGGIQSLSGDYAALGASMSAGAEVAVSALDVRDDELAVTYEECDDQTEANAAVSCYERYMAEGEVSFLVGPALSPATAAIDPLVAEDDVMGAVLGGGWGGNDLNGNELLVAGLPSTQSTMAAMVDHATAQGLEDVFMISAAGVLGDDCRSFWEDERYADRAGQVNYLGNTDVDPETSDFSPVVSEVPDDADMTFICLSGGPGVQAAAAYANAGIEAPMYGIHSQGQEATAAAYSDAGVPDGAIYVPSWCMKAALEGGLLPEGSSCADRTAELEEAHEASGTDAPLDIMLGMTYDLTILLAEACQATDCSGSAMSEHIYQGEGSTFEGVLGSYEFGPERRRGLDESNFLMTRLEGGSWAVDDLLALDD